LKSQGAAPNSSAVENLPDIIVLTTRDWSSK